MEYLCEAKPVPRDQSIHRVIYPAARSANPRQPKPDIIRAPGEISSSAQLYMMSSANDYRVGKPTRRMQTCDMCKSRHQKCSGGQPRCTNCELRGINCTYSNLRTHRLDRASRSPESAFPPSSVSGVLHPVETLLILCVELVDHPFQMLTTTVFIRRYLVILYVGTKFALFADG